MTTYHIPTDIEEKINVFLLDDRYESPDDVLRDAIRALENERQEIAAIAEGIQDMEQGHVRPLREFDREFRQRHNIPEDF